MTWLRRNWLGALAALAIGAFAVQMFSDNKADVDLWGNVGFVKAWPGTPGFLMENTFSFTAPQHPWVNHEWMAEFILNAAYVRFGDTGPLALKLALGGALLALLIRKARRDGSSGPTFLFFLLAVLSTLSFGFATRPHLFTFVLYALFLLALTAPRLPRGSALILAPIAVLWTNLHGAFFIGILLPLVWAAADLAAGFLPGRPRPDGRRTAFLTGAALLFFGLSFLNPYGPRLWSFVCTSAAERRPYLSEWAPFHPLRDGADHVDFLVLAVLTVVGLVFSRKRREPAHVAVLALTLAAAVFMRRNIPLFALTAGMLATPHVVSAAAPAVDRLIGRLRPAVQGALLAGFAALCLFHGWGFGKAAPLRIEVPPSRFPVQAVRLIEQQGMSGNLLVFFDWAEYAIWRLHPRCRVFLDGRFDSAYPLPLIEDYFAFLYGAPTWRKALDAYDTDMMLLHTDNPATRLMDLESDWTLVYRDPLASLFLKTARHEANLAALGNAVIEPLPKVSLFP
jgi:hypothetical protein